ncbi:hypothetical protein BC834DRAFT_119982 [Gloeopeniophorella convolvens]|nr:hypothetical protein BC834DRAFT_119982 [Gloeopeniophorella convolvens]
MLETWSLESRDSACLASGASLVRLPPFPDNEPIVPVPPDAPPAPPPIPAPPVGQHILPNGVRLRPVLATVTNNIFARQALAHILTLSRALPVFPLLSLPCHSPPCLRLCIAVWGRCSSCSLGLIYPCAPVHCAACSTSRRTLRSMGAMLLPLPWWSSNQPGTTACSGVEQSQTRESERREHRAESDNTNVEAIPFVTCTYYALYYKVIEEL